MRASRSLFVAALLTSATLHGQTASFDVISVRPSQPPNGPMMVRAGARQGDSWLANNATLRMLIRAAYAPDYQMEGMLVGGPGWMDTERFDITAKMVPGTNAEQMQAMVRAMLAERFTLVVRRETRELAVYALMLAREDGRLGPEMKPLGVDCDQVRDARGRGSAPLPDPRAGGPTPQCLTNFMYSSVMRVMSGGMKVAQLLPALSSATGRPVVDRTGLSGDFAVNLTFARDPGAPGPFGPTPTPQANAPAADAPSLFSALRDQLGLKLESTREPVEILVIERAEIPPPD